MAAEVIGLDSASQGNFTAADLDAYIARGLDYIDLYEKWATPALTALIRGKGLGISPVFESSAERALAGHDAGVADAKAFVAAIPAKFGVAALPPAVAVAAALDFDVTAAQQPTCLDYLRGWKDGLAGALRLKDYGNGAIGEAAKAAGIIDIEWTAGGSGMRGTAAVLQAGSEDERQDVGDKQNLGGRFVIDSDVVLDADVSWIWWPEGDPRQQAPTGGTQPQPSVAALPRLADLQTVWKSQGWYDGDVDNRWGPQSAAALAKMGAYYAQHNP